MTILFDQADGAVCERGQNYRTAAMMDHFANVGPITFADRVYGDIEDATAEDGLRINEFRSLWFGHETASLIVNGNVIQSAGNLRGSVARDFRSGAWCAG